MSVRVALVLAACASCLVHGAPGQGRIADIVRGAKASGQRSITVRDLPHEGVLDSIASYLRQHSVFLVTPRRLRVSQVAFPLESPSAILTWNTFEILDVLYRPAPGFIDRSCEWQMPASPAFGGDELPVLFFGGTLEFEGVTITMANQADVELVAGARYVLLAAECTDGSVRFNSPRDLFGVEPDGLLTAKQTVPPQMQTLQRLRETLLSLK